MYVPTTVCARVCPAQPRARPPRSLIASGSETKKNDAKGRTGIRASTGLPSAHLRVPGVFVKEGSVPEQLKGVKKPLSRQTLVDSGRVAVVPPLVGWQGWSKRLGMHNLPFITPPPLVQFDLCT